MHLCTSAVAPHCDIVAEMDAHVNIGDADVALGQFDKRGRMYSKGYHINLQASGYKKALLDFSEPMPIEGEL
jgi:hypothetical protein